MVFTKFKTRMTGTKSFQISVTQSYKFSITGTQEIRELKVVDR